MVRLLRIRNYVAEYAAFVFQISKMAACKEARRKISLDIYGDHSIGDTITLVFPTDFRYSCRNDLLLVMPLSLKQKRKING